MPRRPRNVYQRNGRWWGVVPRGGGESERVSLGLPRTATQADAATRWAELVRRQRATDAAAATPRVGQALDDYVREQKRRGRSKATLEIDDTKAGHFLRVWGRDLPLERVDAALVARYIEQREAEDAHPRTIQRELVVLRGALKLALHVGRYATPLERVMPLGYAPRYVPRKRWLTPDEARRLLAALPAERRRWVAFVLATGARKSEVERAELVDVAADHSTVRLRGTKTADADADVPITSLQRPWLELAMHGANEEGPAFGVWTNVLRGLRKACARAKIPSCTPNDLRRTLGYWLRDGGVEPHLIGKVLRHVDSRMAELVYARGSKRGLHSLLEAQLSVRHAVRDADARQRQQRRQRRGKR